MGVGEIIITSIDNEGTYNGIDLELQNEIAKANIKQPVTLSGGIGNVNHILEIKKKIISVGYA